MGAVLFVELAIIPSSDTRLVVRCWMPFAKMYWATGVRGALPQSSHSVGDRLAEVL
jgi:hypothetical protein